MPGQLFMGAGIAIGAGLSICAAGAQRDAATAGTFVVTPVAERRVAALPSRPLYWHVERFEHHAGAARDAQALSLFVEEPGATWRFTLSGDQLPRSTGSLVARIGPVPVPAAKEYLLRINRAGGPPGARTPVHTHPGSEAFFVRAGSLCQRTGHGTSRLDAGQAMNGHVPGMTMQLASCGKASLDQFVMFVVDAAKPFSAPAQFR